MQFYKNISNSVLIFSLLLSFSCSYNSLNAGHGDPEKGSDEDVFTPRFPYVQQETFSNEVSWMQRNAQFAFTEWHSDTHVQTSDEYFYDDIVQKWIEDTIPKIPEEVLNGAFAQPNITEKIINKMGYLQAALRFYPHTLEVLIPNLYDTISESTRRNNNLNPVTRFNVGWLLSRDGNPSPNYEAIFENFSYAAENLYEKIPLAQYMLGLMYHEGRGVAQDPETAFKWFNRAAGYGLPIAQYYLATYFRELNQQEMANFWRDQAILNGCLDAQYELSQALLNSNIRQDQEKGLYWLHKVAHSDLPVGQYRLAQILAEQGLYEISLPWMHRAAANGHPHAEEELIQMQQKLQGTSNSEKPRESYDSSENAQSKWNKKINKIYTKLDTQKEDHLYFHHPDYFENTEIDDNFPLNPIISLHQELAQFEIKILKLLDFVSSSVPFSVLNEVEKMHRIFNGSYTFDDPYYQLAHESLNLISSENWDEQLKNAQENFAKIKVLFNNPSFIFFLEGRYELNEFTYYLNNPSPLSEEEGYPSREEKIGVLKDGFSQTQQNFWSLSLDEQNARMEPTIQNTLDELREQEELLIKSMKKISSFLKEYEEWKKMKENI